MNDLQMHNAVQDTLTQYMEISKKAYLAAGNKQIDQHYMTAVAQQVAEYAEAFQDLSPPEAVLGLSRALTNFIAEQTGLS